MPVYPPREDIQVGDIYGGEINPAVEPVKQRTVYLASIDLSHEILQYLGTRYKFHDTTDDKTATVNGKAGVLPSQVDAMASEGGRTHHVMDRGVDLQTLPIDGFPDITVDSGISVGVQGAFANLGVALGLQAAQTHHMNLHFDSVTSYGITIPVAIAALDSFCRQNAGKPLNQNLCSSQLLTYSLNQKYALGAGSSVSIKRADPLMVSKVYLARQITFSFDDSALAAAAASLATKQGTSAPTIDMAAINTAVANKDATTLAQLAAIQTALNDSVSKNTSNTNGATVSLAGFSKTSVSFAEVFQRPVVIGYEAVTEFSDLYSGRGGQK